MEEGRRGEDADTERTAGLPCGDHTDAYRR